MNALAGSEFTVKTCPRLDEAGASTALVSTTVAFVLGDGFDALTLSSAIAPLRAANEMARMDLFRWKFLGTTAHPVRSSDGWAADVQGIGDNVLDFDHIYICGASDPVRTTASAVPDLIRRAWRLGKVVGALHGGIFDLARSGILRGHRFVVHQNLSAVFESVWPSLEYASDLYAIHDRIVTCAGGVAAADMMIATISDHLGRDVQNGALQACVLSSMRPGGAPQALSAASRTGSRNMALQQALQWLDAHYLERECLAGLDAICGVSPRQLQRLFRQYLEVSPKAYVTELRLKRAASLVCQTDMSVAEIATECGYELTSTFTKAFRDRFGVVPSRFARRPEGGGRSFSFAERAHRDAG